jgi:DNA-binding HxlR family transcriptional regulator
MRQTSFADMNCSLARALELVGDWWSPLILRDLSLGPRRFEELAENLGLSRNLLTSRLNHLVESGVVTRTAYVARPPRYDYDLSESGHDLAPVLMALTAWGDRWTAPEGERPVNYRHRGACTQIFTPTVCCSACGQAVTMHDVDVLPGPGHPAKGTTLARAFMAERLATTNDQLRKAGR